MGIQGVMTKFVVQASFITLGAATKRRMAMVLPDFQNFIFITMEVFMIILITTLVLGLSLAVMGTTSLYSVTSLHVIIPLSTMQQGLCILTKICAVLGTWKAISGIATLP